MSQTEVTTEDKEDELSINEDPTLVSIDDLTSKKEQSTKMIPEEQDWLEENMDSWIDDDEDLSPMSTMSSVNLQWTELEGLVELNTVDTDKEVGDLEVPSELKLNNKTSIYPSKSSNNSTWSINDDCKYFDNQCHNIGENDKPDNEEIQQVDLTVSSEQKTSSHTHIDGLLEQNSYVME